VCSLCAKEEERVGGECCCILGFLKILGIYLFLHNNGGVQEEKNVGVQSARRKT